MTPCFDPPYYDIHCVTNMNSGVILPTVEIISSAELQICFLISTDKDSSVIVMECLTTISL